MLKPILAIEIPRYPFHTVEALAIQETLEAGEVITTARQGMRPPIDADPNRLVLADIERFLLDLRVVTRVVELPDEEDFHGGSINSEYRGVGAVKVVTHTLRQGIVLGKSTNVQDYASDRYRSPQSFACACSEVKSASSNTVSR